VARAWKFSYPFVVAPAMNTLMWEHPITSIQIKTLESWGVQVIDPVYKELICGDKGIGAMAHVKDIVDKVRELVSKLNLS
jgi:phosphopantothenoylcysteine decarboxylase